MGAQLCYAGGPCPNHENPHARRQEQAKGRRLTTETSLQPRSVLSEIHDWQQYYRKDWTPDRGSDVHEFERRKEQRPALVETGRWEHTMVQCFSMGTNPAASFSMLAATLLLFEADPDLLPMPEA